MRLALPGSYYFYFDARPLPPSRLEHNRDMNPRDFFLSYLITDSLVLFSLCVALLVVLSLVLLSPSSVRWTRRGWVRWRRGWKETEVSQQITLGYTQSYVRIYVPVQSMYRITYHSLFNLHGTGTCKLTEIVLRRESTLSIKRNPILVFLNWSVVNFSMRFD